MKVQIPKISIPKLSLPILKKKAKVDLALQINHTVARLLSLDKNKKPTFEPVEIDWWNKSEYEKKHLLKDVVEKLGLKGKSVIASLDYKDVLLKVLKYPATMSMSDLKSAIDWSIKRELSASKEEMVYDYFLLDKFKETKQVMVLLVLARKSAVDDCIAMLKDASLDPKILDFELLALVNYGLYLNLPLPISILYIDYHYSVLVSLSQSNLSYSEINWGFAEYQEFEDEDHLERFLSEVRNLIVINDLSSVYLAGPVLMNSELLERFMENLPVLGLLDLEGIKPNFLIPYMLFIRGMEG